MQTREWQPGDVIRGKFRIVSLIGPGRLGIVFKAEHLALGELRALKLLYGQFHHDEGLVRLLRQEIQSLRPLNHPNAIRIEGLEHPADGPSFLVMEYVDGESLEDMFRQAGPLPPMPVIEIARQICSALDCAHNLGIVHQDIRPDNVLLVRQPDGRCLVKVLDFGLAKFKEAVAQRGIDIRGITKTKSGHVVGIPPYLSPQQAAGPPGQPLDRHADIYSLGVVICEALTGGPPSSADAAARTSPGSSSGRQSKEKLPEPLGEIVMKALNTDAASRFHSASDLALALEMAEELLDRKAAENGEEKPKPTERRERGAAPPPTARASNRPARPDSGFTSGMRPPVEKFPPSSLEEAEVEEGLDIPPPLPVFRSGNARPAHRGVSSEPIYLPPLDVESFLQDLPEIRGDTEGVREAEAVIPTEPIVVADAVEELIDAIPVIPSEPVELFVPAAGVPEASSISRPQPPGPDAQGKKEERSAAQVSSRGAKELQTADPEAQGKKQEPTAAQISSSGVKAPPITSPEVQGKKPEQPAAQISLGGVKEPLTTGPEARVKKPEPPAAQIFSGGAMEPRKAVSAESPRKVQVAIGLPVQAPAKSAPRNLLSAQPVLSLGNPPAKGNESRVGLFALAAILFASLGWLVVQKVMGVRVQSMSGTRAQNGVQAAAPQILPSATRANSAIGNSPPQPLNASAPYAAANTESKGPERASRETAPESAPTPVKPEPRPATGEAASLPRKPIQKTPARVQQSVPVQSALAAPALPRLVARKSPITSTPAPPKRTPVRKLSSAQVAALKDKLVVANFFMDRIDYSSAMQAFEAALKIDPSNSDAQAGLKRARQASAAQQAANHP